MAKKQSKIKTKQVLIAITDVIVKGDKKKGRKPITVALMTVDITLTRNEKLERFAVQVPLDDNREMARYVRELVAQAIELKYPTEDFDVL